MSIYSSHIQTKALLLFALLSSTYGFLLPPRQALVRTSKLSAVTEEQVLAAVEHAEALWARALEARKNADEAAGKAEAVRANNDGDHDKSHLAKTIVNLASVADGIEAETFIEQAERFTEEAEKIEAKAENALKETEELLEQHLKDFPNSPLAD